MFLICSSSSCAYTLTFDFPFFRYGEGIPIDQLPTHVQDELSEIEQDYSPGSSSTAASNLRPSKDIPVEEGGAGGPISSSATSFASTTSGSEPESEPLLQSYAESISESYSSSSSSSSSSTIDVAPPNNRYVILRWRYVTAHDCHPAGYDTYPWPSSWGKWTPNWAGECDANNGNQQVYHNCAEILILGSGTKLVPQAESLQESQESPAVSAADVTEIFANNDYAKTMGRNPVKIDVTANDIGSPFLRVAGTRNGRHGSCSVTKDNQVIYTANDDNWYDHSRATFGGKDRCAYMACIENGNKDEVEVCDEGKIYIEVNPDPSIEIANSLTPLLASEGTITAYDDGAVTGIDQPIRIRSSPTINSRLIFHQSSPPFTSMRLMGTAKHIIIKCYTLRIMALQVGIIVIIECALILYRLTYVTKQGLPSGCLVISSQILPIQVSQILLSPFLTLSLSSPI